QSSGRDFEVVASSATTRATCSTRRFSPCWSASRGLMNSERIQARLTGVAAAIVGALSRSGSGRAFRQSISRVPPLETQQSCRIETGSQPVSYYEYGRKGDEPQTLSERRD